VPGNKGVDSAELDSRAVRAMFEEAAGRNLHLALASLPTRFFAECAPEMKADQENVTCLRSVLMKPEHREWVERIYEVLEQSAVAVTV